MLATSYAKSKKCNVSSLAMEIKSLDFDSGMIRIEILLEVGT